MAAQRALEGDGSIHAAQALEGVILSDYPDDERFDELGEVLALYAPGQGTAAGHRWRRGGDARLESEFRWQEHNAHDVRVSGRAEAVGEAQSRDVQVTLSWHADADGGLTGELRIRNVADRTVRLAGKPRLRPLGLHDEPLAAETVVTLELLLPGYVDIDPGEEAVTPVGWAGWDGEPASGEVRVEWPGGHATVTAQGPSQPSASGPATNLWSTWFRRTNAPEA
jgi:hypothetical protein